MTELRILRGSSFADVVPAVAAIGRDEFERALEASNVPATRSPAGDDAWWVRYPEWLSAKSVNELWFAASWSPSGFVSCVVSSSNCRVIRNAIDLLGQALRLAELLGARVFTEDREVTSDNMQGFFGPEATDDRWMRGVVDRWNATLARLEDEPVGAVEVPVNGSDVVPEYSLIHVVPTRSVMLSELQAALEAQGEEVQTSDAGLFVMSGNSFAAQMFERPNGNWQIRPGHARVSWPRGASALLACMRVARELSQGHARLVGVPLDEELERELEARTSSSGLEMSLWFREHYSAGQLTRPSAPPATEGPSDWLERNIALAVERKGEASRASCSFDRSSVVWLEAHLLELRDASAEDRKEVVPIFGAFLGECIASSFGGTWTTLKGSASGLAVAVQPNVFVAPWDKVEGFLDGDDGDSVVGFFDVIGRQYTTMPVTGPTFVS